MIFHTTQMANITISKTAIPYGIPAGSRHRPIWIPMPAATVLATAASVLPKNGIAADLLAFVPMDATCEVNRLTLTNQTDAPKYPGALFLR